MKNQNKISVSQLEARIEDFEENVEYIQEIQSELLSELDTIRYLMRLIKRERNHFIHY